MCDVDLLFLVPLQLPNVQLRCYAFGQTISRLTVDGVHGGCLLQVHLQIGLDAAAAIGDMQ